MPVFFALPSRKPTLIYRKRVLFNDGKLVAGCRMAMLSHLIRPGGFSVLFVGLISETPSGNSVVAAYKFLQPIKVKTRRSGVFFEE